MRSEDGPQCKKKLKRKMSQRYIMEKPKLQSILTGLTPCATE